MGNCMEDSTCTGGMMGGCHEGGGGSCTMPECPMQEMCNMMGMNCEGMMGACPDSMACHGGGGTQRDHTRRILASKPNPFNPTTTLSYGLQAARQVRLTVWNTSGKLVAVLADAWMEAGNYTATFNGANLPTGLYLARLQVGREVSTLKLVLIK